MQIAHDIATCMYYTGIDPFTKQAVYIAKGLRDRKMQRALMQFFKSENYFAVREALLQTGRQDLIGNGYDCLIPALPPKEAIEARRCRANEPDHYHTVANPSKGEPAGERGLPSHGGTGRGGSRPAGRRRSGSERGRVAARRRENGVGGSSGAVPQAELAARFGVEPPRP